ncbi:DUF2490 domain-containing protein [Robiginitalea sp.]|uniref:DUF2490 domain-containing protein n=1 Tax=Robiginitalea sp. TaxID=1902411 RepID=UPI003C471942
MVFLTQGVTAQDSIVDQEVQVNEQAWLDYNFKSLTNNSRFLSTQVGFRTINPSVYNRFLVISTLNLRAKRWFKSKKEDSEPLIRSYHLGTGTIYTRNYNETDNFEIRFIQGVKFNIPTIKDFKLYNYTRLEERFQTAFDGDGWESGFRLRHRVSIAISWKKHYLNFTKGLYFPISAEIFFNLKKADQFNDVLRLSPGIGYKFESGLKLELYTIYNLSRNITETNDASNDFILRLRIYRKSPQIDAAPLAPENEFDETEEDNSPKLP